jgi:hypothetical protein
MIGCNENLTVIEKILSQRKRKEHAGAAGPFARRVGATGSVRLKFPTVNTGCCHPANRLSADLTAGMDRKRLV